MWYMYYRGIIMYYGITGYVYQKMNPEIMVFR